MLIACFTVMFEAEFTLLEDFLNRIARLFLVTLIAPSFAFTYTIPSLLNYLRSLLDLALSALFLQESDVMLIEEPYCHLSLQSFLELHIVTVEGMNFDKVLIIHLLNCKF